MSIARTDQKDDQAVADKPLLRVLGGERLDPPPVWLMRQAGRYLPEYRALREKAGGFLDLCYTPEMAAEVTLQPVRRFGLDAAILFSDILVVPDAMGMALEFRQGEGPVLDALREEGDIRRLITDGGAVTEALAPVYETVAKVKTALPSEVTLIGFAGAPWTVASYMLEGGSSRDFAVAKEWMWRRPQAFAALMDALVEVTTAHLSAQIAAGAEAVQLFDSWAGALPDPAFRAWSVAPAREIVRRLKAVHPGVAVIGFPRGAGANYPLYAAETDVDALSLDTAVPMGWAAEAVPEGVTLQGNLDPIQLLVGGEALERAVADIRAQAGGRAHVFNLGHGVVPATPPEHVARLVELVRR